MLGFSSYNCAVCHRIRHLQSCNIPQDTIGRPAQATTTKTTTGSSRNTTITTPSPMSMGDVPRENAVRSLLKSVVPNFVVDKLELAPAAGVQRIYNVKSPDGDTLQLAFPPHPSVPILNTEKSSIRSGAAVIEFLTSHCQHESLQAADSYQYNTPSSHDDEEASSGQSRRQPLNAFLPHLVEHSSVVQQNSETLEFNLTRPIAGQVATTLSPPLTTEEQHSINRQAGRLLRLVSSVSSPNKRFGAARLVLPAPGRLKSTKTVPEPQVMAENRSTESWSEAFLAMMEATLRDLEYRQVQVNYVRIRRHCSRFGHLLDAVTRPCLVPINIGEESNLLVLEQQEVTTKGQGRRGTNGKKQCRKSLSENTDPSDSIKEAHRPVSNEFQEKVSLGGKSLKCVRVTGLQDWSNCIFGDVLIASSFGDSSKSGFLRGFLDPPIFSEPRQDVASPSPIEDQAHAHVRLHLYECFHAAATIAREFLRNEKDNVDTEMAARKKLINAMEKLDEFDDTGHPIHERPEGELSPAKKPKTKALQKREDLPDHA